MSNLTCPSPSAPSTATWPSPLSGRPITAVAPVNIFAPPPRFPGRAMKAEFSACLDGNDRFIHVAEAWNTFAPDEIHRRDMLGRPIEWFVADETARECFRTLLERVRKQNQTAKIVTRCDQPNSARAMQLTFMPFAAGEIEIVWSLFEGARARDIAAVPRRNFHEGELLRMCSWCRKVHMHTTWKPIEAAAPAIGLLERCNMPLITHGICPGCSGALMAESIERQALAISV